MAASMGREDIVGDPQRRGRNAHVNTHDVGDDRGPGSSHQQARSLSSRQKGVSVAERFAERVIKRVAERRVSRKDPPATATPDAVPGGGAPKPTRAGPHHHKAPIGRSKQHRAPAAPDA